MPAARSSVAGRRFAEQAAKRLSTCGLDGTPASSASSTAVEHGLLIVLQHQRQDLDHLAIATGALEQDGLQALEALRQIGKRCAVAQRAGFALHDT